MFENIRDILARKKPEPANMQAVLGFGICILLLLCALINFNRIYAYGNAPKAIFADISDLKRRSFFITFYVFFALSFFALGCAYVFVRRSYRTAGIIAAYIGVLLAGYAVPDNFSVKLCLYSAWIITAALQQNCPFNLTAVLSGTLLYLFFLLHPALFGIVGILNEPIKPVRTEHLYAFIAYTLCTASLSLLLQHTSEKRQNSCDTVLHLNTIMSQMSIVNQKLQNAVKKHSEEAAEEERLRISRDMHDSLGYVFTNIIGLMDGAVSSNGENWKQLQEICQIVRDQAKTGLQETRKTLRAIRNIKEPFFQSIDTVYQLKHIFEEVTGICVSIESGNMRHNYGHTVNTVLTRTIQEAFTNSVRHGRATHIEISFWEFPDHLSMTVCDNGVGSKKIVKGIGLAGMEERLLKIKGSLRIFSPAEGGFRLIVNIPLLNLEHADGSKRNKKN